MKKDSKIADSVVYATRNGGPRKDKIRHIVIHHAAGVLTADALGAWFNNAPNLVNSTYTIGHDGSCCQCLPESYRPWTTSGADPDEMAVTIEVSNSENGYPWRVSDKSLSKLIELVADIAERNGFKSISYTGDKNGTLLMHKWYTSTTCPGPYLSSKFPYIRDEVNKILSKEQKKPPAQLWRVQTKPTEDKAEFDTICVKLSNEDIGYFVINRGLEKIAQLGAFEDKKRAIDLATKYRKQGYKLLVVYN